jgi:hypothetical protein
MASRGIRIVPLVLGTLCLVGGILFVLPSDDGPSGTPLAFYSEFGESVVSVFGWLLIALGIAILAAVISDARKRRRSAKPSA